MKGKYIRQIVSENDCETFNDILDSCIKDGWVVDGDVVVTRLFRVSAGFPYVNYTQTFKRWVSDKKEGENKHD